MPSINKGLIFQHSLQRTRMNMEVVTWKKISVEVGPLESRRMD
jgi:hypothetical protein